MSTAAAFKYPRAFPFCVGNESGASYSFVRNLTLAEAMGFYWNLEDLAFAFVGTVTETGNGTTSFTGNISFSPPTVSGDANNLTLADFFDSGMLVPTASSGIGSLPSPRKPRERVCLQNSANAVIACQFSGDQTTHKIDQFGLSIAVFKDSINSGKYSLGYSFLMQAGQASRPVVAIKNPALSISNVYTRIGTGTFSISGKSFDYECWFTTGYTSFTGGTMSVTSTSFTY